MTFRSSINGVSAETLIVQAIESHGPLLDAVSVPNVVAGQYEKNIPDLVLDIWDNFGVGDLDEGRLRLCVPRSLQGVVDSLFDGDPYLGGDTYALAYGAFGDLVLWNTRHQMVYVNMQLASVDVPSLIDPARRVPDDEAAFEGLLQRHPLIMDAFDANGDMMFEAAQKRFDALPPLHIYGMYPPAPVNEAFALDNHKVVEVDEWLALKVAETTFRLDDLARERFGVRDIGPLPDGQDPLPAGKL